MSNGGVNEKTWQKNAPSQITLNSIFAAMVGVLIAIAIQDTTIANRYKFFELILLVCAFLFFAVSAEQTTNALDEKDVKKYVYYMIWYNAGVILTGFSIGVIVYAHFGTKILCYVNANLSCYRIYPSAIMVSLCLITFLLLSHWIYDLVWLLFCGQAEMIQYYEELDDKRKPEIDRSWLMSKYLKWKKIL